MTAVWIALAVRGARSRRLCRAGCSSIAARAATVPSWCGSSTSRTRPRCDPTTGAVRSVQKADLVIEESALEGDLDAGAPRAAGAHLLALPDARDARPDPGPLHRGRALGGADRLAPAAAHLPGARIRDGRRRTASCAGASSGGCWSHGAGAAATATCRSRCAATPGEDATRAAARRGRGRQLLPSIASGLGRAPLQRDPVAYPRDRHLRLPALARAPRPRRI